MKVAITRPPSILTKGWHAVPVTARHSIAPAVADFTQALRTETPVWIAVTSAFVFRLLEAEGIVLPGRHRLACVGHATAQAAPKPPDFVGPPPASAEAMVRAFPAGAGRVLFPCSAQASTVLEEGLTGLGYDVDRFDIYRSEPDRRGVEELAALGADAVIVTAGSAASSIATHWPPGLEIPPLIALGEPTAHALDAAGFSAASVSATPDRTGLEACLERISRDSSTA